MAKKAAPDNSRNATISLVLGIFGFLFSLAYASILLNQPVLFIVALILLLFGVPMAGIYFGLLGLKAKEKQLAKIGLVLSIIALIGVLVIFVVLYFILRSMPMSGPLQF